MTSPQSVGLFGGSFDPPHIAHVMAVTYALSVFDLERVIVMPTFQHPFDKSLTRYEHRVRMCELAMADLDRVEVSTLEGELGGESRTLRTLEALAPKLGGAQLRLLIGSDLLPETPRWYGWDRIEQLAPPLVIPRSGHDSSAAFALPPVSSTEVRARLAAREPVEGFVPRRVIEYVARERLYT